MTRLWNHLTIRYTISFTADDGLFSRFLFINFDSWSVCFCKLCTL